MPDPVLLSWVRRLAGIAQTGLEFSPGVFDRQRYEQIRRIAAEMVANNGAEIDRIDALFAAETGYATPKLICRSAVFDTDDRILMVRETADGRWTLPGGWIDIGESPAAAAERETWEESGYQVRVIKLAAIFDKLRHGHPPAPNHSYLLFFLCEMLGGEPEMSVETSEVGWFGENSLPELSDGRATEWQISRMWAHHYQPALPTDFDA